MSRKHYVALARALNARYLEATPAERDLIRNIADDIADVAKADNPRFDRARFHAAVCAS